MTLQARSPCASHHFMSIRRENPGTSARLWSKLATGTPEAPISGRPHAEARKSRSRSNLSGTPPCARAGHGTRQPVVDDRATRASTSSKAWTGLFGEPACTDSQRCRIGWHWATTLSWRRHRCYPGTPIAHGPRTRLGRALLSNNCRATTWRPQLLGWGGGPSGELRPAPVSWSAPSSTGRLLPATPLRAWSI